jgi:3-methyl-2-oxobutanoate hydroxymethyltransferase
MEVVPGDVAAAISARTSMLMLSMGAGTGCDAQYLFAESVLGSNRGHFPRHAKTYHNFAADTPACRKSVSLPLPNSPPTCALGLTRKGHLVGIAEKELSAFLANSNAASACRPKVRHSNDIHKHGTAPDEERCMRLFRP